MADSPTSFPRSIVSRADPFRSTITRNDRTMTNEYRNPLSYLANEGQFLSPSRIGHLDGWGVGTIQNGKARIVDSSGGSAFDEMERVDAAMEQCVDADSFSTHVRRGSIDPVTKQLRGGRTRLNAQPFRRVSKRLGPLLGAHCGDLANFGSFPLRDPGLYLGETDSEWLFHYLVDCIEKRNDFILGLIEGIQTILDRGDWYMCDLVFVNPDYLAVFAATDYDVLFRKDESLPFGTGSLDFYTNLRMFEDRDKDGALLSRILCAQWLPIPEETRPWDESVWKFLEMNKLYVFNRHHEAIWTIPLHKRGEALSDLAEAAHIL